MNQSLESEFHHSALKSLEIVGRGSVMKGYILVLYL